MFRPLWVAIYSSILETRIEESFSDFTGLTFETVLPGGFGTASFSVPLDLSMAYRWYGRYLGYHVVIYDAFYTRVYEGMISSMGFSVDGLDISLAGYYSLAAENTCGLYYPITVPITATEVVRDCIALMSSWNQNANVMDIVETTGDITPQDFTGEVKITDAIEEVLKFGDGDTLPHPVYFAIWEHRIPKLFIEPGAQDYTDSSWTVPMGNMSDSSGVQLEVSRASLFNKIQVFFDDQYGGKMFTDWYEDTLSQERWGVKEGSMNIGSASLAVAELVGELAIAYKKIPSQEASLSLQGSIQSKIGEDYPLYMLRAGDTIRVLDFEALVVSELPYATGSGFVTRTSYNYDNNTMSVDLGNKSAYIDILLARLGIDSGNIS